MADAHSMVERVASERGMETKSYLEALVNGPLNGMTRDQMLIAFGDIHRTGLDPLSEEILFLKKGNKVTTTIRYIGITKLMRRQGITNVNVEYVNHEDGEIECRATLGKNVSGEVESFCRPEFLSECRQKTQPWDKYPRKMLGHRAVMQSARLACDINLPSADEYLEAGFTKPQSEAVPAVVDEEFQVIGGENAQS